jgi:hypothetical protein
MSNVKLVIIEGLNYERRVLGVFDLEIIPRIGECVFFENEGDDGPTCYKVKDVVHNLQPRFPTEIWMVSLDDEIYHKN